MAEFIVRGTGHLLRPCFSVVDWKAHDRMVRREPGFNAAERAKQMAILASFLESEGIDPINPLPAVQHLPENSKLFLAAEWLMTLRSFEEAATHGAHDETKFDIAKELGVIIERFRWLGFTLPDLGATLALLAEKELMAGHARRRGGITNKEKAAGVSVTIWRLAGEEGRPGLSKRQLALRVLAKWPAGEDEKPSFRTIQRHLAKT